MTSGHQREQQPTPSPTRPEAAPEGAGPEHRDFAAFAGAGPRAGLLADHLLPAEPEVLDRRSADRADASFLRSLIEQPGAVAVLYSQRRALHSGGHLAFLPASQLPSAWLDGLLVYLGRLPQERTTARADPGADVVLVVLDEPVEPVSAVMSEPASEGAALLPEDTNWAGFRESGPGLDAVEAGILLEATAIANWHAVHPRCPRCGAATQVVQSGWVRHCPEDGSEHFPRTDPAIIVTVVGPDDRLLLATGARMRSTMFSTLAGFVEPGESLEQAVAREILEEVGVRVTECQYLGSQPWPFPASLMLGFTARTEDTAAAPDGVEVLRARWFTREELSEAAGSGEIALPSSLSISRALIEHWYGGRIADPASAASR
ncbi:NTP pyrophosphohydrolase [Sinomonas cellulolyticus]|uniref:NAD(+) diphosphatase n=1 Tax=Sinomonas cellulolyticus TaxID=2801916 RepID=A0ABS1K056_9MICC|nr:MULTISPECIES: NAD(+) diphosphatase [Sinomonas]MBL0704853.1 NAD(+) diphosphatase [Sinomonas cellulolyticus]GHG47433.1 NTP pyrophosphohydrolase [Sinomonas sp. KCTC 49339]